MTALDRPTVRPPRMIRTRLRSLVGLVTVGVILLVWQWWASSRPVFFLPTPSRIAERLGDEWLSGSVTQAFLSDRAWAAATQTFSVALSGWLIAAVLGVVIGASMGAWRLMAAVVAPPLNLLRSIPPVAVIPICIVVLGLGTSMRTTVVVFGCIWPVLLNSLLGVASIDATLRDVARLNRLSVPMRFLRVLLPAASPTIFAGLRTSLSLALVLAVGAEMFAGTGGLGGATIAAQSSFDVVGLWSALAILAVAGALLNWLLVLAGRFALRWNLQEDPS